MPHAEPKKMGENVVNGEKVHSHFLDVSHASIATLPGPSLTLDIAPHILPRRLRLHLRLQEQQVRRQVHRVRRPEL